MAKSRKIASTKAGKPASEKKAPAAEVEVVEEKRGMGWEDGVAVITTIVIVVAILCVDYDLGHKFGAGMFFK
jgi:hypothetical protein